MTETVITVEGLMPPGYDRLIGFMRKVLRGYATSAGRVQLRQKVGLSMSSEGMAKEAASLNATITATAGVLVLLGHSRGSEIISLWMELYGRHAPPELLARIRLVILLGNVQRKYGGKGGRRADGAVLKPTPTDLPIDVIDLTRSMDPWGNADGWWKTPGAITAAALNSWRNRAHNDYSKVDLFGADVLERRREGRTTFLVAP